MNLNRSIVSVLAVAALSACNSSGAPTTPPTKKEDPVNAEKLKIGGCISKKCGPTTEEFFSNTTYGTLKLTFTEEDLKAYDATPDQWEDLLWSKWNSTCGPYTWIPVNMLYQQGDGGKQYLLNKVGIRMRGSRSRGANPLAGFKLDFNEFLSKDLERRFADLTRFEVLSNEKDDSVMVQCMTYQFMRDFGVNAPRCNHVRVIINDKVYGMLESVERGKDKRYLDHHFGTTDGALYAASSTCGWVDSLADLEFKGDTYTGEYTGIYEILEGTPADAEANLIPMLKCGDNVQTPDDEAFKACIQEWISVEEWLRLIAAESLTPTVEDFVGARRNFFMYFQPNEFAPHAGYMRIWGWDYDTALHRQACSPNTCDPFKGVTAWYGPLGQRAKLVVRLTKVFREQYCSLMREFLDTVFLPEKVDTMAAVIQPAMMQDPITTPEAWQAKVAEMRAYMVTHKEAMKTAVDTACGAPAPATSAGAAGAAGAAATLTSAAGAGGTSSM